MSPYAHFAVFWLAGLLTGTLLGWMLGRNHRAGARREQPEPAQTQSPDERQAA